MSGSKPYYVLITILIYMAIGSLVRGAEYQLFVEDAALQSYSMNALGQSLVSLPPVRRSRLAALTPALTSGSEIMAGDTVILNLFADTRYIARIDKISTNINQTITMSGFVESYPFSDVFICQTGDRILVSIYIPDTDQRFIVRSELGAGVYNLLEVDTTQLPLLEDGPPLLAYVENYLDDTIPEQDLTESGPLDPVNIDVMIVYTPGAYEDAESYFSGIENYLAQLISEANTVLSRSQTYATLTLVHSAKVDYVEDKLLPWEEDSGSLHTALYNLKLPDVAIWMRSMNGGTNTEPTWCPFM